VQRFIASLILLAFVAATAGPAIAACRMRAAKDACCCEPAPASSLCAPDCCDRVLQARPLADLSTSVPGFVLVAQPALSAFARSELSPRALASPPACWRVGLHQRAAPRLPLRV
jgi:hypothetical protein